ncbi:MAG: alpha-amylase family glycosyl hydrolase, partial [Desulfobacterales bacterium]|nr:alpha-amylase family glycosyl hydrolase [Desulfobacterales bacterium]
MMTVPRATYRLQLNKDFTFAHALALVPYLDDLGISHVYLSPILRAQPGSTHGYDVCDVTRINPEVGTEADLEVLVAALREEGMGLVLDIVPNHMAVARENPWWWDVLRNGRGSAFADCFDIDWDSPDPDLRGRVLLPVLGDELERVLDRGELRLVCEAGEWMVAYFDHRYPVRPDTVPTPGEGMGAAPAGPDTDRLAMVRLLGQQHYQLAFWRHGDRRLNYRRFFTITDLAGVRVEVPEVFTQTHGRII